MFKKIALIAIMAFSLSSSTVFAAEVNTPAINTDTTEELSEWKIWDSKTAGTWPTFNHYWRKGAGQCIFKRFGWNRNVSEGLSWGRQYCGFTYRRWQAYVHSYGYYFYRFPFREK